MIRRPHVTDHALLRYLERVYGFNIDAYRHEIEAKVALAVSVGASGLLSNGFRYALDDVRVMTVDMVGSDPEVLHRPAQEGDDD